MGKIEREREKKKQHTHTHSEKINKATRSLQLHSKAHKTDADSNYRHLLYEFLCASNEYPTFRQFEM